MTRLALPLEDELAQRIADARLPRPKRQYRWHPTRKFTSDFAWPESRLLVEADGGQWMPNTGHNSGAGKERDCIKDAEAVALGWRVLRFTSNMVRDGRAVEYIGKCL